MELDHIIPPPVAFYFNVHFIGPLPIMDMAFMEVSGLTVEMDTEEIEEGGGVKRKVPTRMKHGNLVCKRPMKPIAMSGLSMWTASCMEGDFSVPIPTCEVVVTLLQAPGIPQCGWALADAYPVKWDIAPFDSKKNEVAIETIEFAYNVIKRIM